MAKFTNKRPMKNEPTAESYAGELKRLEGLLSGLHVFEKDMEALEDLKAWRGTNRMIMRVQARYFQVLALSKQLHLHIGEEDAATKTN